MRSLLAVLIVLGSSAIPLACQLVDPESSLEGTQPSQADGSVFTDANGDSGADGATSVDASCPGTGGPLALRVGSSSSSFCIDSTEVSDRQYRTFLIATDGGATVTQPSYCSWNQDFTPANGSMADDFPVAGIDWCDARAFCAWSGKRLCGKIGGDSLSPSSLGDPSASQWLAACAHAADGGFEHYPYGDTFNPKACNGIELTDGGGTVIVASLPLCVGGYPSLHDMTGNVDEWIDDCNNTVGSGDCCQTVGGSFKEDGVACGLGASAAPTCVSRTRKDTHSDVGFRCCSD